MKNLTKSAFIIVIIYSFLYLALFWQTPLGNAPVLDGAENITLAHQIAKGSLPHEPFFRSMLYPAILSVPLSFGLSDTQSIFYLANILGILSHLISTIFVYLCCCNIWQEKKIAQLSILLYGLYAPSVFFAAEPLDTSLAICFMLSSLYTYLIALDTNKKYKFILSGILFAICGLLRSNLLPFGIIFIIAPILTRKYILNSVFTVLTISLFFVINGLICFYHSNEFKLLPWQGTYNLYSANCKTANGKFYKNTIYLPDRKIGDNPARLESEIIYTNETGKKKPFNLNDFNKFWLNKTYAEITNNFSTWILLNTKKVYYLFNNYEQYNNKTFSFYKDRNPILRYNPIGFGLLLILVSLTILNLPKIPQKHLIILSGIVTLSISIVFFYVSARFRLPLAPLLVIIGSGILSCNHNELLTKKNIVLLVLVSFITFSAFFDVSDKSTWKEDMLLNAFACSRLQLDEEQIYWANQVLEKDSNNIQAMRLKIVAFTNLVLAGKFNDSNDWQQVKKELEFLNSHNMHFNDCLLLQSCFIYRFEKDYEKAEYLWSLCSQNNPNLIELLQALKEYSKLDNNTVYPISNIKILEFLLGIKK